MPTYAKSTKTQLRKRLAEVIRDLSAASPEGPALVEEMQLIQRLLEAQEHGTEHMFSKVRSIVNAIELCFDLQNDWISKQEIFDMILKGGYPIKPETGKGLIRDTLNYHTGTGRIATKGELYGKPEWLKRS